jgi:polyisoprenoid-binding protein YceI
LILPVTVPDDPIGGLDGIRRWAYGSGMALRAGHYRSGPDRGQLIVRTFRQGLAATVGHDLVIEFTDWATEITIEGDKAGITAQINLATLVVREGVGGVTPLSDRDRRDIAHTARKLLDTDHQPSAGFTSAKATTTDSGGDIEGTLTVRGVDQPLTLGVTELGDDRYRATGSVLLSTYGVKRYTAFFGALKLADRVEIDVRLDLSGLSHELD